MAYRPGSQIRNFIKDGGFTLTDQSPNYGTGKIPLFKSLRNLNAKERLYAIGYNFSTLGAFGLDIGAALSVPYLIGEYTNTARSFIRNVKNPSSVMSGDIIKRQKLLGGAKYVNHAKRAVTQALRTNTPIDRATSIIIGRESAGMLQNIREFGAGGSALKIIQEANSQKFDAEILRQANIPSKENVFRKWQVLAFTEAFKNAPDPFRDNPIRKAEKIRHKTVKKNKAEFNIDDVTFRHNLSKGLSIDRADELMSFADMMLLNNHPGIQGDLVEGLLDVESAKYFKGTKYENSSVKARIKQYEEAQYHSAGAIMRSGSPRTTDYKERELFVDDPKFSSVNSRSNYLEGIDPVSGKRGRIQDIVFDSETQMGSNINSRTLQRELDVAFKDSIVKDLNDVPLDNLNAFHIGPEIVPALRELAKAFNHPFGASRFGNISGANLSDILSSILTTVAADDLKKNYFVGVPMQTAALDTFRNVLKKNGYKTLSNAVYKKAGYFYEGSDPMRPQYTKTFSALRERQELRNKLTNSLDNGIIYNFLTGDSQGPPEVAFRFRPAGSMIENKKYYREILNRQRGKNLSMHRHSLQRILIDARGQASRSSKIKLGYIQRFTERMRIGSELKVKEDGSKEQIPVYKKVDVPGHESGRLLTYSDFFTGQVPGMKVKIDLTNGKYKGIEWGDSYKKLDKGDKIMGKTKGWWEKRVGNMHTEYINLAKSHLGIKQYDDMKIYNFIMFGESDRILDRNMRKKSFKEINEFKNAWNPVPESGTDAFVKVVEPGSKGDRKGVSVAQSYHHNFVPLREQIRASIHMHDMERYGKNENDGTNFIFRFSVSAGGKNKTSKHADAIRDIRSIEFGGFAHDRNMKREKRTDNMVYLPSHFMGIAGTKAAAYLGIWDKGSEFKTNVDGQKYIAKIATEGSISPYDLKSDGGNNKDRIYTRQKATKLKEEVRQGNARLRKLERDIEKVMRDGARTNSSFNSEGARIASQRALALYRETGQFGSINAGDIFKMMDADMANNLGFTGDKFASNYMFNVNKLGHYSLTNQNRKLGELKRADIIHDISHSYSQGKNSVGRMYAQQMRDRETGATLYGQMPEIPLTLAEFNNIKSSFTTFRREPGKQIKVDTDWESFEAFTGVSRAQLYALNEQSKTAGAIPMKFNNYTLESQINPSGNATVRKMLRDPINEIVTAFGLDKTNGPLSTVTGGRLTLNSPAHPSNVFKKIFLSGEMTNHIVYESQQRMLRQTSVLRSKSTEAGRKMIEQKIKEESIEAGRAFNRYLNRALQQEMFSSPELSELSFRKTLQKLAFGMRATIINSGHAVRNIRLRYGRMKPISDEVAENFVTDGKIDLDTFDFDNLIQIPDEMGWKIVEVDSKMTVVRDLNEKLNLTQAELEMMDLYDPLSTLRQSFSVDPKYGTAGPKVVRDMNYGIDDIGFNNIASQSRAKQIIKGISQANMSKEAQREFRREITELYDANADEALRAAGIDFDNGGGKILGKTYHGIALDIDDMEKVAIETYRSGRTLKQASDERVADLLGKSYVKQASRIKMHKKAKNGAPSHVLAIEYWKNFRYDYKPAEMYKELIELVHTRLSSPATKGSTQDIANLIKEIWIGTAKPKKMLNGGKTVHVGYLNVGKASIADGLNTLPPEYNKMEHVIAMTGFTGGKRITTKQRGHQIIEFNDADFMKIATLLKQQATAGRRGTAGRRYEDNIFREFNSIEELKRLYGRE